MPWKILPGTGKSWWQLTVVSGFGKTLSIRTSLNDTSYIAPVDAMLETMKLDKTAKLPGNNKNNGTVPTTGAAGKFGSMAGFPQKGYMNSTPGYGQKITGGTGELTHSAMDAVC